MAILEVQDIHTYYGDAYVLQGLSLQLEQGQILGLLGRNGVGKSTLVNSIVGFNPPRRGKIVFKGDDITGKSSFETVRSGMGLVPQGRRVFPTLGVEENLLVAERSPDRHGWNLDRVYKLFPRLHERRLQGREAGVEGHILDIRAFVDSARTRGDRSSGKRFGIGRIGCAGSVERGLEEHIGKRLQRIGRQACRNEARRNAARRNELRSFHGERAVLAPQIFGAKRQRQQCGELSGRGLVHEDFDLAVGREFVHKLSAMSAGRGGQRNGGNSRFGVHVGARKGRLLAVDCES